MEKSWQQFIQTYEARISYQYCLAGMIQDWKQFNDPANPISNPTEMGALWAQVQQEQGISLNEKLWAEDPPSSSYPACLAVKTAGLQSHLAAEKYLSNLREAAMVQGLNISSTSVLFDVARQTSAANPGLLDMHRFGADFNGRESRLAFKDDIRKVRSNGIQRFPTFTFTLNGKGLMITGFRPFETLVGALRQVLSVG